MYIYLYIIIKF